jgi:two-component system KDP operon response regulator KdpE
MGQPANESAGGVRVLVVDDKRAIRRFLQVSLTAHSYTVFEAVSGQEALEAVTTYRPDIREKE